MSWLWKWNKEDTSLQARHYYHPRQGSCDLWDIVLDMDWPRVISHAQEHPQDALWQDGDVLETPLHLACQLNPPLRAIQALLKAAPTAVQIPSRHGQLPLHLACSSGVSTTVLKLLVQRYPETSCEPCKWGKTPLVNLMHHRRDDEDETLWIQAQVLLQAVARAKHFSNSTCSQPLLVHAAVSLGALGCPSQVLDYMLQLYPHHVFLTDDVHKRLPLHICVGPSVAKAQQRKFKPREQEVFARLLDRHPQAAWVPMDDNRYPLHVALINRHTWQGGIRQLAMAAPNVVQEMETSRYCLYPFQLAAVSKGGTKVDLETIFQLLRMRPDILRYHCCDDNGDVRKATPSTNGRLPSYTAIHTWIVVVAILSYILALRE